MTELDVGVCLISTPPLCWYDGCGSRKPELLVSCPSPPLPQMPVPPPPLACTALPQPSPLPPRARADASHPMSPTKHGGARMPLPPPSPSTAPARPSKQWAAAPCQQPMRALPGQPCEPPTAAALAPAALLAAKGTDGAVCGTRHSARAAVAHRGRGMRGSMRDGYGVLSSACSRLSKTRCATYGQLKAPRPFAPHSTARGKTCFPVAVLIAMAKLDGGVRQIAICEGLLCIASLCVLAVFTSAAVDDPVAVRCIPQHLSEVPQHRLALPQGSRGSHAAGDVTVTP